MFTYVLATDITRECLITCVLDSDDGDKNALYYRLGLHYFIPSDFDCGIVCIRSDQLVR